MDINNSFKEKRDNNKMDNTKSKKTLCEVCNNGVLTKNYKRHLVSKKHLKNLKQQDTGVEEKQEETKQEQKEEKKEQPKPKQKQKQKKDKIKIVIPVSETCSKDCLRQRELRLKKNPEIKIKPTPNREWLTIGGVLETKAEREIRLRRERQKKYRDKKRLEKLEKQKQNKK